MFGNKNKHQEDLTLFTVFDSKSRSYREPVYTENQETLIRDFLIAFKKPSAAENNQYFQAAEDFSIFKIGTYDKKTGKMVLENPMVHVVNMHDLRAMATKPEPRALSST